MQFPICSVCLKSNIICNACAEKLGKMDIEIDEIKIFRHLNKFFKDEKTLKNVEIKRAVGKKILMIIVRKGDISRLVGRGGRMVKKLAKELNMPVRVIEESPSLKDFVSDVFFTVPILGINVVYKPEGEVYTVRIPKSERMKLPISSDVFTSVSKSLFNVNADVVFE